MTDHVHGAQMGLGAGTLSRAADLVAQARLDLDGVSSRLEGQVTSVAGRWVGAGGNAFQALHAAWTDRQRMVTRALDDFEAALRGTEGDFLAADDAASAAHAALHHRLG